MVFNGSWWVPLGCHASVVRGEVLRGNGSVLGPEVLEECDWSTASKFGDRVFERREVFFGTAVCDHGDEDDLEFAKSFEIFACKIVLAGGFSELNGSETGGVRRSHARIDWCCCERSSSVGESDVLDVSDDKTEESEYGISSGDCHGLVLDAFLKGFERLAVRFLC